MDCYRIGVISDTHGLMRPEALEALKGARSIIHAGDIGTPEVLEALERIAPVTAVRGNVDKGLWCRSLPRSATVEAGQLWLYVIHELSALDIDPGAAGIAGVIFGHSHKPSIEMRNRVVFLNPGSAGPRRFRLPVSVAVIEVKENRLEPQLIELAIK